MPVQGFVLDRFPQRVAPFDRGFHRGVLPLFQQRVARSIGHGRRRLTDRQAFSLGVIDLFSVCFEEHLTDCGIIVIHILEEPLLGDPLLGHGLCGGLDVSLREEVVLGLGRRNSLRIIVMKKRKKRSRESERTAQHVMAMEMTMRDTPTS